MSTAATYQVHIDLDNDRKYTSLNEDVSAYVKSLTWQLGAVEPYADIARTNTLNMVLSNSSQRFSPEHGSGLAGFRPGALVRVRSVYSAATRQHFIGWIDPDGGIDVIPGTQGNRETRVRASGFFSQIMNSPVRVPIQIDKRADEIIDAILSRTTIYPPGLIGWLLGIAGFSNLGQNTYLSAGSSDYAVLDTGVNVFNYVGDTWNERTNIFAALRELIAAERGYLFENRDGKIVFYSRHHWHKDMVNAVDDTLSGTDVDRRRRLDYTYGNVLNRRVIKFHPRTVGTVAEVVGRSASTPQVPAGEQLDIRVGFSEEGRRIGARDVITPAATTDWTANSASDGTGTDLTSNVAVSMTADASGATLIFTNSASATAYIRNLQIRGTKITDYGEDEVSYQDNDSINANTLRAETLYLGLLDDIGSAQDMARWDVMTRKDPNGQVLSITRRANRSDSAMTYALARTIGDRIALSETQTGHADEYFIIGEKHEVDSKFAHLVTHFLRPAPASTAWILGVAGFSNLGETTYLAA